MNEVKKLAKLLCDLDAYAYNTSFENQAQFLMANGVTFAKDEKPTHGHWIVGLDGSYMCSECGRVFRYEIGGYCSFCGAKLEYEE